MTQLSDRDGLAVRGPAEGAEGADDDDDDDGSRVKGQQVVVTQGLG